MRETNPILRDKLCQPGSKEFLLFSYIFVLEHNKASSVVIEAIAGSQSDCLVRPSD